MDDAGALVIQPLAAEKQELLVHWWSHGGPDDEPWGLRLQLPRAAVRELTVEAPARWRLQNADRAEWSPASSDLNAPRQAVFHRGGAGDIDLELLPPGARALRRGLVIWQSAHSFALRPDAIDFEAKFH